MAQFQNYFATRLYTDIGASDSTITVETPPTATSGRLALEARNATQREIVKYTGVSGNDLTGVTRGQGGTTAKAHLKNSLVEMNVMAEDIQDLYDAFASFSAYASNGWATAAVTLSAITALGNRSYSATTNVDMTSILSPGMRLRTARTVAAPTQSTSLNGTNQYYSKASPNGLTFTDDFTVSAWVKVSSYGAAGAIISRYNGTSGWSFEIHSTGQVLLVGWNASSANFSQVLSVQSIPLNKWVHVSAQLDMSAFTATSTTSYVMINGADVPATVSRGGTNPTALVQAGNLEVGSRNGGTNFFLGNMAQAAVFSAKVTQATLRGYISQALAGTETSLASAYSFNSVITDLNTTNTNNLTANGSAVATATDSPFGGKADGTISSTLDYAIVQKVTSTTLTVQAAEGCTIPTSGGVTTVSYSPFDSPYGFPKQRDKWRLEVVLGVRVASAAGIASGTWVNNGGLNLLVPVGSWKLGYEMPGIVGPSVSVTFLGFAGGLSTSASAVSDNRLIATSPSIAASTTQSGATLVKEKDVSASVATQYYYIMRSSTAGATFTLYTHEDTTIINAVGLIYAENAYL